MREVKTVLKGRFEDTTETRNIFYHTADNDEPGNIIAGVGEWISVLLGFWLPQVSNQWSAYACDVYLWDTGDDDWFLASEFAIDVGTGGGTDRYNANQDAAVLIARTGDGTNPGKKFVAGLDDDRMVNGKVTDAALSELLDILTIWVTDFVATSGMTLLPVIISKVGHVIHPIVGGVVDAVIGSQRRRKPGNGI